MRWWKVPPPEDEPPRDPEIDRWFQAIGPPPSGQAPPHLQARVRARILHQQARPIVFGWLSRLVTPTWTVVLATGLIVSLGLHVWLGIANGGAYRAELRPLTSPTASVRSAARPLYAYRFQADMQHAQYVGRWITTPVTLPAAMPIVGFTPQTRRTTFCRLGVLFAEALATLRGNTVEATAARLEALVHTLTAIQAPRVLEHYLREMQTLLQSQRYTGEEMATFLALFEPLYEDAYARLSPDEGVRLFQTGIWLENTYLAAAAKEPAVLQQAGQAAVDVHRLLTTLRAPQDVLDGLTRLRQLATKPTLTEADIGTIQTLVQTIRTTLSE